MSHSSCILSFDLIGEHQNKRFYVRETVFSLIVANVIFKRERRDDRKCVCGSQASILLWEYFISAPPPSPTTNRHSKQLYCTYAYRFFLRTQCSGLIAYWTSNPNVTGLSARHCHGVQYRVCFRKTRNFPPRFLSTQ